MRKWVYKLFSIVLCALVIGASADVAFALPKKLPKLKGGKRPRITVPKTLGTRKIPSTPTVRPNVVAQVERATANAAKQAAATKAVTPVKAPEVVTPATETPSKTPQKRAPKKTPQQIIDAFKKWVTDYPGTSPRMGMGENGKKLTKAELRKRAEQGDEQAAKLADELELGVAIYTALRNWSQDSYEYKELKALYDVNRNQAEPKTRQQVIDEYKQWIEKYQGTSPRQVIQENGKVFSLPELRKRAQKGDEQAAKLADELELGRAICYALSNWPQDSNEYKELKSLYNANRNTKTPQQIIAAYKQWTIDHPGTSPRVEISEKGISILLTELRERAEQGDEQAAELAYELELGSNLHHALSYWPKTFPKEYQEIRALYDQNRNYAVAKKPQQIIAAFKQWAIDHPGTSPRKSIGENGKQITLTELRERARQGDVQAAELAYELELGIATNTALHSWPQNSNESKELKALYDANRNTKTRQQVILAYKQWVATHPGTSPRMTIWENGKYPSSLTELRARARQGDEQAANLAYELELGLAIRNGLHNWPQDGSEYKTLKALYDENRNQAARKQTDELYQDLVAHIKNYGHYPMQRKSSLYINIYARLRYYQSTMTADGKYADPWLQKIYELKQWSERVKRGEVDWDKFPGLFKKHRRTIGEMMREKSQLPPKETPKELEQLSAEEQQAIEQMADNMLTLWEDFEDVWWKQNHKHVITTPQTQLAFNTVLNAVRNQVPGASNVNISNVLEQVNSMQLGEDKPSYYRVIYRGNNPRIPRAEDFHNVKEITGLPQQYAQPAYKLNAQHISLDGDDEMVYNMFLTDGVTDKEISAVIDALTPAGWEVRIGAHEMLSNIKNGKVHIHLEQIVPTTEEYAMDISHVLNVNLRALTRGKNPQQVAKTLRYLFANYLKEDGHQALNNIQKAF